MIPPTLIRPGALRCTLLGITLAAAASSAQLVYDFEESNPFSGGTLSTEHAVSGQNSLYLASTDQATLGIPAEFAGKDVYVSMMVYDQGLWIDRGVEGRPAASYGPRWGVSTGEHANDQSIGISIMERNQIPSADGYALQGINGEGNDTPFANSWFSPSFFSGGRLATLTPGTGGSNVDGAWVAGDGGEGQWSEWVFYVSADGSETSVTVGDKTVSSYGIGASPTQVWLWGGRGNADSLPMGGLYVDDVKIMAGADATLVGVEAAPVIDGAMEDAWRAAPGLYLGNLTGGIAAEDADDFTARWYGLYDADYFYLAIDIRDEVLEDEAGDADWKNDRIEVYFNMDNVIPAGNARTGDNYQFYFDWNGEFGVTPNGSSEGVLFEQSNTDKGYSVEIAFPWDTLFVNTPDGSSGQGYQFGFDIAINDNDGNANYDSIYYWWNTEGGLWGGMDNAGSVVLGGLFGGNYPPEIEPVVGIQYANEGESASFTVSASDVNEDDDLTFTAEGAPGFVEITTNDDRTATVTIDAGAGDANIYPFSISVSDGNRSDSTDVLLIVKDPAVQNQVPQFDAIDAVTINQNESVSVGLFVTDLDSLSVSIALADGAPGWAAVVDNGDKTGELTISPSFATSPGDYTITVEATDAEGTVGSIDVDVEVLEVTVPGAWFDSYRATSAQSADTGSFLGELWYGSQPWFFQVETGTWFYAASDGIVPGEGGWIYSLEVLDGHVGSADPRWAGFEIFDGWAWTGMGWFYVTEAPYVYSNALATWLYAEEDLILAGTPWLYVFDGNDGTVPTEPTMMRATPVDDNRIEITWRASTDDVGVEGYDVYRDGAYMGTVIKGMTFSDRYLAEGSSHEYAVRAFDATGNVSPWSASVRATTLDSWDDVAASWQEAWDSWDEPTIEAWYLNNTGPGGMGIEEDELWVASDRELRIDEDWLEANEGDHVFKEDGEWVVQGVQAGWFVIDYAPITVRGLLALVPTDAATTLAIGRPSAAQQSGGETIRIEYSRVRAAPGATPSGVRGIEGSDLIVRNSQVGPGLDAGSGFRMWNRSLAEYNWVHHTTGHHSGIAIRGSDTVVRRNYTEIGTSASLFIYAHDTGAPETGLNNILVEQNYINSPVSYYGMNPGGARNDKAQSATNVRVLMNRWGEKNFWPDDSHDIGGSHRTWLGDIPDGDYVDVRGNIWGGNHWIATGNYIKPQTSEFAWDHPDHVYDDPWVEARQPTPAEAEIEASWEAAWNSNDQAVIDAWYEQNTGPAALGVYYYNMWFVGDVVIDENWLLANAGPHVFQENGRWVVQAIRASSVDIDVDYLILRASMIEMDATNTTFGIEGDGKGVMIEYCEITNINENNPQSSKGIASIDTFTVRHTEVHGLPFTAIRLSDDSIGKYNYVHSGVEGIKHVSIAIRGNNTHAYRNNLQTNSGSATLGIYSHDVLAPPTGFDNVLVEENLINGKGGHYAMMAGGEWNSQTQQATNIVVINNKFGVKFNASSGWTGSNYLWLGRAEAGECVDDRGNTWYGNTWLTTGNYVEPSPNNGVDDPSDVYDDPCADQ